jgi:hypothetical protein
MVRCLHDRSHLQAPVAEYPRMAGTLFDSECGLGRRFACSVHTKSDGSDLQHIIFSQQGFFDSVAVVEGACDFVEIDEYGALILKHDLAVEGRDRGKCDSYITSVSSANEVSTFTDVKVTILATFSLHD